MRDEEGIAGRIMRGKGLVIGSVRQAVIDHKPLAAGTSKAETVKTVYVPVFKTSPASHDEAIRLAELLIKVIERETPLKGGQLAGGGRLRPRSYLEAGGTPAR